MQATLETSESCEFTKKRIRALISYFFGGLKNMVLHSDVSGREKVGFGWIREFPEFKKSGSDISGMEEFGFGRVRVLKFRVSGTRRV